MPSSQLAGASSPSSRAFSRSGALNSLGRTEVDRTGYNTRDYYWLAGAGQVVVRVERSEERVVDLEVWHAPGSLPDG